MTPSEVPDELVDMLLSDVGFIASAPSPAHRLQLAAETAARILTRYQERTVAAVESYSRRTYAQ